MTSYGMARCSRPVLSHADQVARTPVVAEDEARLGHPRQQAVQQRPALVLGPTHDVVGRGPDQERAAAVAATPDQWVLAAGHPRPCGSFFVGRIGGRQELSGSEAVDDPEVGQLGLLVLRQGVVRGVGVGELGVAPLVGDHQGGQQGGLLGDVVHGAVEVPVDRAAAVGRQCALGRVEADHVHAGMVFEPAHPRDHDRPEHLGEGEQVGVADVRLPVDHHPVLVQRRLALGGPDGVHQLVAGPADDLEADLRGDLRRRHRHENDIITVSARRSSCVRVEGGWSRD